MKRPKGQKKILMLVKKCEDGEYLKKRKKKNEMKIQEEKEKKNKIKNKAKAMKRAE